MNRCGLVHESRAGLSVVLFGAAAFPTAFRSGDREPVSSIQGRPADESFGFEEYEARSGVLFNKKTNGAFV